MRGGGIRKEHKGTRKWEDKNGWRFFCNSFPIYLETMMKKTGGVSCTAWAATER